MPDIEEFAVSMPEDLNDDDKKLRDATKDIYGGDEFMTRLAETSVKLRAKDEG